MANPTTPTPYRKKNLRPIDERFWAKVEKTDTCWLWRGYIKPSGHGQMQRGRRGEGAVNAHIIAYELLVGPLSEGDVLHHRCGVKHCVNPDHLQLTDRAEHVLLHLTDECPNGHPYNSMTPTVRKNDGVRGRVWIYRSCAICEQARRRRGRR